MQNSLDRSMHEQVPVTDDETAWAEASAAAFLGDDDEEWDAHFPEQPT